MKLTRRQAIKLSAAAGAATLLNPAEAVMPKRKRVLRIAHLTDIHVQPEKEGGKGMAACLNHVHSLKDKPDLILTGGDLIMDAFEEGAERTKVQWDLFTKVMRDFTDLPVEHCIGNHDVWTNAPQTGGGVDYRKKLALDTLGLKERYRSFDRNGWHFIVLDSTFVLEKGYTAKLDDEQFEWLQSDLQGTPKDKPVLVLSHIPIVTATAYFDGQNEKSGNWVVPGSWMHIDARRIKALFLKHPNVKVCLSGHMHLVDRVDYSGVTYYCNGAVCGAWWGGDYHEFSPGYGALNLYSDGRSDNEYVTYGWKPVASI